MNGRAVAIILGRAGSKGLPGKNMRPVAGKPCAAWTIEHARQSRHVAHVVVTSDDAELRELAQRMNATAFDRPAALAGDAATIDAAARDALARFEDRHGLLPSTAPVVLLYANVPVRPEDLTDRAAELFEQSLARKDDAQAVDSVQSFSRVGKHHPWWMVRIDEGAAQGGSEGALRPWQDEAHGLFHGVFRRQDLPPAFVPDGGVTVVSREALMLELHRVPPGPHAFLGRPARRRGIVSGDAHAEHAVVDIDTPIDLLVAEAVLSARGHGVRAERPS